MTDDFYEATDAAGVVRRLRMLDGTPFVEVDAVLQDTYGEEVDPITLQLVEPREHTNAAKRYAPRGRLHWTLSFACPFGCKKSPRSKKPRTHYHGGGLHEDGVVALGHRVAHCFPRNPAQMFPSSMANPNNPGGYYLVLRGEEREVLD